MELRPELSEKIKELEARESAAVKAAKFEFLTDAVKLFEQLDSSELSEIEQRQLKIYKMHLSKLSPNH